MKKFLQLVFFVFAIVVPVSLFAQADFRRLSSEEAARVLEEFRNYRMQGDICWKFEITHYLRKEDETKTFSGTLYGTWDENGAILRVEISPKESPDAKKSFLLRGGKTPELWSLDAENKPVRADGNLNVPFFDGLIFTPFDLNTPFVYWQDADYERTRRFRGRPVHFFKMNPPENFRAANAEIGFVRIGFDRVYNALVSAEIFDGNGKLKRTFSLSGVQKVQGQYTIRELELRDDATRDKDELVVRSAALNLLLPKKTFRAADLASPPPVVPAERFSDL